MSMGMVNKDTAATIPAAGNTGDKVGNLAALHTTVKSDIVAAVNEVKDEQANKADMDIVADAFSAAETYAAGDYCTYEGGLYKFKTAHEGAWNAADVDRIKIAGELSELKNTLTSMGNMRMSKLWENPNPNVTFAAQNIILNSDDYDLLLIIFANTSVASARRLSSVTILKGYSANATIAGWADNAALNFGRYITYVSDTVFSVGEGYDSNSSTVNNTRGIPIVIYGIKLT